MQGRIFRDQDRPIGRHQKMIDETSVQSALIAVRSVLHSDGGDIELLAIDGDAVRLRLLIEHAKCAECVLSRSMLELVALDLMRSALPSLKAVAIEDPREL